MTERSIFIVRHGERIDHVDPQWTDTAPRPWDPPLTETGHIQGAKTGISIRNHGGATVIFTSPFLRCVQTASAIAPWLGNPPVRIETGLSEFLDVRYYSDTPTYVPREELETYLPSYDPSHRSIRPAHFPEEYDSMVRRFTSTAKALARNHSGEDLVFVTHGYGMSHLLQALVPEQYLTNSQYCAITHLREKQGVFRLERTADPTHWRTKKGQKHSKYYVQGLS